TGVAPVGITPGLLTGVVDPNYLLYSPVPCSMQCIDEGGGERLLEWSAKSKSPGKSSKLGPRSINSWGSWAVDSEGEGEQGPKNARGERPVHHTDGGSLKLYQQQQHQLQHQLQNQLQPRQMEMREKIQKHQVHLVNARTAIMSEALGGTDGADLPDELSLNESSEETDDWEEEINESSTSSDRDSCMEVDDVTNNLDSALPNE
ncbi:unnamed protein product, partial [Choristocarpus tenellus]